MRTVSTTFFMTSFVELGSVWTLLRVGSDRSGFYQAILEKLFGIASGGGGYVRIFPRPKL